MTQPLDPLDWDDAMRNILGAEQDIDAFRVAYPAWIGLDMSFWESRQSTEAHNASPWNHWMPNGSDWNKITLYRYRNLGSRGTINFQLIRATVYFYEGGDDSPARQAKLLMDTSQSIIDGIDANQYLDPQMFRDVATRFTNVHTYLTGDGQTQLRAMYAEIDDGHAIEGSAADAFAWAMRDMAQGMEQLAANISGRFELNYNHYVNTGWPSVLTKAAQEIDSFRLHLREAWTAYKAWQHYDPNTLVDALLKSMERQVDEADQHRPSRTQGRQEAWIFHFGDVLSGAGNSTYDLIQQSEWLRLNTDLKNEWINRYKNLDTASQTATRLLIATYNELLEAFARGVINIPHLPYPQPGPPGVGGTPPPGGSDGAVPPPGGSGGFDGSTPPPGGGSGSEFGGGGTEFGGGGGGSEFGGGGGGGSEFGGGSGGSGGFSGAGFGAGTGDGSGGSGGFSGAGVGGSGFDTSDPASGSGGSGGGTGGSGGMIGAGIGGLGTGGLGTGGLSGGSSGTGRPGGTGTGGSGGVIGSGGMTGGTPSPLDPGDLGSGGFGGSTGVTPGGFNTGGLTPNNPSGMALGPLGTPPAGYAPAGVGSFPAGAVAGGALASGGANVGGLPGAMGNPVSGDGGSSAGAGMGGMPFMPPMGRMGGGGKENEKERERTTWLAEEEAVWGTDPDVTAAVIGREEPEPEHGTRPVQRPGRPGTTQPTYEPSRGRGNR
ncbi:hypothetical protein [Dactylosporangium sp. NPDC005555]|uniref:hypothetical protein n=1 Tax=Dactylosporangium sp. NPDC005555 TaxID=3154889 RepID=UPI0033B6C264